MAYKPDTSKRTGCICARTGQVGAGEVYVQGKFIYLLTVKEIKPRLLLLEEASAGARSGTVAGFTEANQQSWSCSNLCPRLQLQC